MLEGDGIAVDEEVVGVLGEDNAFPGGVEIPIQGFELFFQGDIEGVILFARGGRKCREARQQGQGQNQNQMFANFHAILLIL